MKITNIKYINMLYLHRKRSPKFRVYKLYELYFFIYFTGGTCNLTDNPTINFCLKKKILI